MRRHASSVGCKKYGAKSRKEVAWGNGWMVEGGRVYRDESVVFCALRVGQAADRQIPYQQWRSIIENCIKLVDLRFPK